MDNTLASFTDLLDDEIGDSQPISFPSSADSNACSFTNNVEDPYTKTRPSKGTGQRGHFRSTEEVDQKYRDVFTYPYFNLVQSKVIDDALYSDKSIVVCAPTGSGKTVVFEMAIVQLLMELEDKNYTEDFKIIYMAPVKALCTERLTEWYPKFTKYGLLCIEATGDTDVDFSQLKPYKIIITTPEKWDMLTRRWRDHRSLVEVIKLFLIDEVHILNDETRGPVLEAVVSRMKTIESSAQSVHRIEQLQNQLQGSAMTHKTAPSIRFVAVSATVSNPEDVASWLGTANKPAVFHKFGDECRPVKLRRIVEGYPCPNGASIFKFDIILNYKLWPVIQKYHSGKPTLIFCNTRKSVTLTAETLAKELTINFNAEQKAKLTALAMTIKNKKLQSLVMSGVGCHHAGLLYEERQIIEQAFRNRDLPILITTTTLAMGVNLPAHLVIIKNTQQYVNGAYQEYSISTVLQMVGRAGRPQFDTEATAVIMTRLADKGRYQALVGGCEPLQSYLHKRLPENLNSEAALGTVGDVAQCVEWLRSTFLYVRASRDPKKYLSLPLKSPQHLITKKIEELCVKAMNGLASSGLITMDEASCIESTEAGRLMSIFYLDVETMKQLMKIEGTENLERLLTLICESHELSDMHLRMDERRSLNALNRNNAATTIRFPMKGKISTRQMKLNCMIQAVLGCLPIPDPSLNQEAMRIIRIADRVCKCLVAYVTRPDLISRQPQFYAAVLNSIILAKCISSHLWENSPFVSKQLKGIGPTFSTMLVSAGKCNFLLLEESHPRDLERIMNKNAPAGNVLRKQINLLPKYQITILPVDESIVTVQLVLLNQNFLSENMDQLTAGGSHKSYIVVGDSDNHLLLLASFKDSDLIRMFDGIIRHEIRRKHNHEHKIFAHCVSTSFVGIDVQSEFLFNDLNKYFGTSATNLDITKAPIKETAKRQTCITDTFKERKRKSTANLDKTQCKEKKKRDNALFESFHYLKKTFENASKNIRENVHMNLNTNREESPNYQIAPEIERDIVEKNEMIKEFNSPNNEIQIIEHTDDDVVDDEKIDCILTEIENEMSKKKAMCSNNMKQIDKAPSHITYKTQMQPKINGYKSSSDTKKRKTLCTKSNYAFLELLERNLDLSDDDDKVVIPSKHNGFSEAIRSQISKFIRKAEDTTKTSDNNIQLLIETDVKLTPSINKHSNETITTDAESKGTLHTTRYPHYEIKEILDGQTVITEINNSKKEEAMDTISIGAASEEALSPTQKLYPHYEIIEILGGQSATEINKRKKEETIDTITIDPDSEETLPATQILRSNYEIIENFNEHSTIVTENDNIKIEDATATVALHDCNSIFKTEKIFEPIPLKYNISDCDTAVSVHTPLHARKYINESSNNEMNVYKPGKIKENYTTFQNQSDDLTQNSNKFVGDNIYFEMGAINPSKDKNIQTEPCSTAQHESEIRVPAKESINASIILFHNTGTNQNNHHNLINGQENMTSKESDSDTVKNCNLNLLPSMNLDSNVNYKSPQNTTKYLPIKNMNLVTGNNDSLPIDTATLGFKITHDDISNLVHTSKNNQRVSNLNNIEHEYYSNNSHEYDRNNKDYVKNFSFSSTNINVCTKSMPKYCVRIIKKVKMDLNITEIISTSQFRENECLKTDNKAIAGIEEIEYGGNPITLNAINHTKQTMNTDFIKDSPFTDNDIRKSNVFYPKCDQALVNNKEPVISLTNKKYMNISSCTSSNQTILTDIQDALIVDDEIQKLDIDCTNNNQPKSPKDINIAQVITATNSVDNEIKENNLCNTNLVKDSSKKTEHKYHTVADNNENNKLMNILQKYSKILGKHTTATQKTSTQPSANKNITNKRLPVEKVVKPFKINNIQTLTTTLPKTLIDYNNQNVDYINAPTITKVVDSPYSYVNPVFKSAESVPRHATDFDLEPITIPDNIDLEPTTDFNIDQSMFDPKTLLQCTIDNDYEEIIPPPVQFCDEAALLNNGVTEDSSTKVDYNQCDESCNADFSAENDLIYNESIFEDNCATNLTPSREIETWTLAEHDSWESSPAKSFTVMRQNISNCSNPSVNGSTAISRKTKLGQFKFNHKSKLRSWK